MKLIVKHTFGYHICRRGRSGSCYCHCPWSLRRDTPWQSAWGIRTQHSFTMRLPTNFQCEGCRCLPRLGECRREAPFTMTFAPTTWPHSAVVTAAMCRLTYDKLPKELVQEFELVLRCSTRVCPFLFHEPTPFDEQRVGDEATQAACGAARGTVLPSRVVEERALEWAAGRRGTGDLGPANVASMWTNGHTTRRKRPNRKKQQFATTSEIDHFNDFNQSCQATWHCHRICLVSVM